MLVAASAREPIQMLHEIMIRDQTMLLTSELKQILSESSYDDEKPHNSETENG
jgi:hypothetical protein